MQAQAWMIGRKTVEIHYTQRRSESGKAPPTARPPGRRGDLARKELFSTARATSVAWSESHIGSIRSGSGDVPARGRRGD